MSREAAFLLNNLLFAGFALVVLTGTVFPLLVQALQNKQITVGEPYFDKLGVPIGLALLFLMAVGPALPWRAASAETLRNRLLVPAWIGGLTLVACVLGGARGIADVIGFGLGAFVLASIARSVVVGRAGAPARDVGSAAGRRAAHRARQPAPLRRAARARRRRRARDGAGDHVGLHDQARGAARARAVHDRARVHRHVPPDAAPSSSAQKTTIEADVQRAARLVDLGTFHPAISSYPNFPDGIGTPAIHSDPWHDVYLTLVSAPDDAGSARRAGHARRAGRHVRDVAVDRRRDHGARHPARAHADPPPAADRRDRRARRPTSRARARRGGDVMKAGVITRHRARWIALTVAVVLVGFGVVLAVQHRTRGVGAAARAGAQAGADLRPHRRSTASRSSSHALAGKTYVVNFWNSWCIPCRQEEPALQTFYAAHRSEPDFAMVGIVRDDDPRRRSATTSRPTRSRGRSRSIRTAAPELGFGTTGQPETYVISPTGVAACGSLGPVTDAELEAWLQVARAGGVCG